jgi:hypothetical protein
MKTFDNNCIDVCIIVIKEIKYKVYIIIKNAALLAE